MCEKNVRYGVIEGYITAKEMAKKWDVTIRTIQAMCSDSRIKGASLEETGLFLRIRKNRQMDE